MPSLLGTYVAANYGRMTSQDTYGGITYNNFGTRNLAFLKISAAGSTIDFTAATGPDTDASNISGYTQQISSFNPATSGSAQTATTIAWADSNSYFSVAVRTIQQFAEVYMVGLPYTTASTSTGFVVAVSLDTANSAATSTNVETWQNNGTTGYIGYPTLITFGALAAQVKNALNTTAQANSAAGTDTVGTGVTGVTITQIFPWGTGFVAPGGSPASS